MSLMETDNDINNSNKKINKRTNNGLDRLEPADLRKEEYYILSNHDKSLLKPHMT